MNSVRVLKDGADAGNPIVIGKQGEDNVTLLRFEFSSVGNQVDPLELSFRIVFQFANPDGATSPPVTFISPSIMAEGEESHYIEYMVEQNALGVAGDGQMEVYGVDVQNDIVWKSNTFSIRVVPELVVTEESIPELPEWIVQLESIQISVVEKTDAMEALRAVVQGKLDRGEFVGPAGPGVAAGGLDGMILTKRSNADYETEWREFTTTIPIGSIGNDKLDRDGANKIEMLTDDIKDGVITNNKLDRVGEDRIAITSDDLSDEILKGIVGGELPIGEVNGVSSGFNFDLDGATQLDDLGNVRAIFGRINEAGTRFGMEAKNADGTISYTYTEDGVMKNGVPIPTADTVYNAVIALRNGLNHAFYTPDQPVGTEEIVLNNGDIWYETDGDKKVYIYNASNETWELADFNGAILSAGTVTAREIAVEAITALLVSAFDITAQRAVIENIIATSMSAIVYTVGTANGARSEMFSLGGLPHLTQYDSSNKKRSDFNYEGLRFYNDDNSSYLFSTTTGDKTITVGSGKDYADAAALWEALPSIVNHNINVVFTYYVNFGDLVIPPLSGSGSLTIGGQGWVLDEWRYTTFTSITANNVGIKLTIKNVQLSNAVENMHFNNCTDVVLTELSIGGSSTGHGVIGVDSRIRMSRCFIHDCAVAVLGDNFSLINVLSLAGDSNAVAYRAVSSMIFSTAGWVDWPAYWGTRNPIVGAVETVSGVVLLPGQSVVTTKDEWEEWIPTINNFTIGSGTVTGKKRKYGNNMCAVSLAITFGTGTAVTGALTVVPPYTPDGASVYANGAIYDASPIARYELDIGIGAGNIAIRAKKTDAAYLTLVDVSGGVPITFASGDGLSFTFVYFGQ